MFTHTHTFISITIYISIHRQICMYISKLIVSTPQFFSLGDPEFELSLSTKGVPFKLVSEAQLSGLLVNRSILPADGSTLSVQQATPLWRPTEVKAEPADGTTLKGSAFN